jgi:hypothetical protein
MIVSYCFRLYNPSNPRLEHRWHDSEGFISFSSAEEGNNEWGNHEFLRVSRITPFLSTNGPNHVFALEVQVTKRSDNTDLANAALHDEIEKTNDEKELIRLANDDIIPLIKKLPVPRNLKKQSKQEDRIVNSFK